MFSPNGVIPETFWPEGQGSEFVLKESLQAARAVSRTNRSCCTASAIKCAAMATTTCAASAACSPASNSSPATSKAAPTPPPAGPKASRSIRKSKTSCKPTRHPHPFRLARIRRHGPRSCRHLDPHVLRRRQQAHRADRRSVPNVRQALRPHERSKRPSAACSTTCKTTSRKSSTSSAARTASFSKNTPRSSARWSKTCKADKSQNVGHAVPQLDPGVKEENDNMPAAQQTADRASWSTASPPISPASPRCNTPTRSATPT